SPRVSRAEQRKAIEQEPVIAFEELRQDLVEHVDAIQQRFQVMHRYLLKWANRQGYSLDFLLRSTSQAVVTGSLMASLLFSAPQQIAHDTMLSPPGDDLHKQEQQVQQAYQARKKYQMTVLAAAKQRAAEQATIKEQLLQLSQQHSMTSDPAVQ